MLLKKFAGGIAACTIIIIVFFGIMVWSVRSRTSTIIASAEYPLAGDQWYINGQIQTVGRGFCKNKPLHETWYLELVRPDGTKAQAIIKPAFSLGAGFPFFEEKFDGFLPGYNAGLSVGELTSTSPHSTEFSCQ